MAVIGLDIGTTGVKGTIFDEQGCILAYAYGEYDIINKGDRYEINPSVLWETTKGVISKAYKNAGHVPIQALCTSSFGEAFVMLDKSGKEIANSPIYMDKRGETECNELVCKLGADEIMKSTGHPPHSMYSICKLMWQKRNNPDILKKTYKILFYGDYILHKLGGQYISDYSLASRSMCFDILRKRWSDKIIEAAGLDISIFPETKMTGTIVGDILPHIADDIGINHGIKLVLGGHDQIMVAVGAGITKKGQAVNGIGTVDCVTPLFQKARLDKRMREYGYASIPYLFEDMYVTYAFNMTGGSLIKWFRDIFAGKDKEIAQKNNQEIYEILNTELPDPPTDIFVLPHFAGAPVPNADIHAKGAIINLTLGTKRGDVFKACMEGETFEIKHNIEALEEAGIPINELRTVGGGSRSERWLQIRADILKKKIIAMNYEEAGTLGTAILAGVASGCYPSVEQAANTLAQAKTYYYPDERKSEFYSKQYEKYKMLYTLLKSMR